MPTPKGSVGSVRRKTPNSGRCSDGAVAYINPRLDRDIVASAAEGYAPPGSSELKKDLEVAQPKSPQPIKP